MANTKIRKVKVNAKMTAVLVRTLLPINRHALDALKANTKIKMINRIAKHATKANTTTKKNKQIVRSAPLEKTTERQERRATVTACCVLREVTTILKDWGQHVIIVQASQSKVLQCALHVFQASTRKQGPMIASTALLGGSRISLIH